MGALMAVEGQLTLAPESPSDDSPHPCVDPGSGWCTDGTDAGLSTADLHARMAVQVDGTVQPCYRPSPARLGRLLRHHVNAGEVELDEHGRWRLTPEGLEAFAGLL